jgi:hypothetical protein
MDLQLPQPIVARLLPTTVSPIDGADVLRAYSLHGDDLREALFALYDVYEERVGRVASPSEI